jgi:cupin 2 domain-containing protein
LKAGNLFTPAPSAEDEELVEELARSTGCRVERIVSHGQQSSEGFWYDQDEDEWVALLSGSALLEFEGEAEPRRLRPGDWLLIPAHRRHRVVATADGEPSVWLAVFWPPTAPRPATRDDR